MKSAMLRKPPPVLPSTTPTRARSVSDKSAAPAVSACSVAVFRALLHGPQPSPQHEAYVSQLTTQSASVAHTVGSPVGTNGGVTSPSGPT